MNEKRAKQAENLNKKIRWCSAAVEDADYFDVALLSKKVRKKISKKLYKLINARLASLKEKLANL